MQVLDFQGESTGNLEKVIWTFLCCLGECGRVLSHRIGFIWDVALGDRPDRG